MSHTPRVLASGELRHDADVLVIGGGQAALAVAYYLRRTGLRYLVLDDRDAPGGAWQSTWDSLRLFSPALWSSLPGFLMPGGAGYYPTRDEAIAYLTDYEARYDVPVLRPVRVMGVRRAGDRLRLETDRGAWSARAVVSATGTWSAPYVPRLPGQEGYRGRVLHSAHYRSPDAFLGQHVVVVGGGNSGAQIVADLHERVAVTWATLAAPAFLPDDIDGRHLFEQATERYRALAEGRPPPPIRSLGDIVAVEAVRRARERGALVARRMFVRFTANGVEWPDGSTTRADAVILATGFTPALDHLRALGLLERDGRVVVRETRSVREPRLWLVGYGDWTGFASATLIGVGRSARAAVNQIVAELAATAEPEHR
jgi:putative flavoprotein involved in K+ transport